jgi:hypothetical protein
MMRAPLDEAMGQARTMPRVQGREMPPRSPEWRLADASGVDGVVRLFAYRTLKSNLILWLSSANQRIFCSPRRSNLARGGTSPARRRAVHPARLAWRQREQA